MRVEMKAHITGTRDGVEWPTVGGTIDLPDHEAADLIGAGLAKEATDEAVEAEADPTGDGPDEAPAEDSDPADPTEQDEPTAEQGKAPAKKAPARKAAPKAKG